MTKDEEILSKANLLAIEMCKHLTVDINKSEFLTICDFIFHISYELKENWFMEYIKYKKNYLLRNDINDWLLSYVKDPILFKSNIFLSTSTKIWWQILNGKRSILTKEKAEAFLKVFRERKNKMFNVEGYTSKKTIPDFLLGIDGNWLSVDSLNKHDIENFSSEEEAEKAIGVADLKGIAYTAVVSSLKWHCQKA